MKTLSQKIQMLTPSHPAAIHEPGGPGSLHVLSEVAASLACEHDLEGLLTRFLRTLIRLSGASAGVVRLITPDGAQLRMLAHVGLPPGMVDSERLVPVDCGVCGAAAKSESVCQVRVFGACRAHHDHPYFEQCRGIVAVPLRFNGKVLGVYNLFMEGEDDIPDDVSAVFTSISEHLGMAVENTRLIRENLRMTLINERQMMANEVHDSLAQSMAYMKMRMALLQDALTAGTTDKATKYATDIQQALEDAYSSLRDLLTEFRKQMDPLGLEHAFREVVANFHSRTGITLTFSNQISNLKLDEEQEVQIFRIVQEALANVVRHSGAAHAWLRMEEASDQYCFTVEDDGRGVFVLGATPDLRHHFGISIMRERAQILGGTVELSNRAKGGARLKLFVPVVARNRGAEA